VISIDRDTVTRAEQAPVRRRLVQERRAGHLVNPRYTGYQVWNRQRTDEVLLDVDNVALGHAARMRWNPADQWLFSERIAHPAIIDQEEFQQAQAILVSRGIAPPKSRTAQKPHRRPRVYPLRGVLLCGLCDRRMTRNWNNDQAYYRCRFPAAYALANRVEHPRPSTCAKPR
jgi:site-specific DNA recombinase